MSHIFFVFVCFLLIIIAIDFSLLSSKPEKSANCFILERTSLKSIWSLRKRVVSSAKRRIFIGLPRSFKTNPFIFSSLRMFLASNSTVHKNRSGDSGHPCLTPLSISKKLDIKLLFLMQLFLSVSNIVIHFKKIGLKPYSVIAFSIALGDRVSNAFE